MNGPVRMIISSKYRFKKGKILYNDPIIRYMSEVTASGGDSFWIRLQMMGFNLDSKRKA
jgi:hypothetical protein